MGERCYDHTEKARKITQSAILVSIPSGSEEKKDEKSKDRKEGLKGLT